MPTKRLRTTRGRTPTIEPAVLAFLRDEPNPEDGMRLDPFLRLELEHVGWDAASQRHLRRFWLEVRDDLLEEWTEEHPGTRPSTWWTLDAPRWDDPYVGCFYHGLMPSPRRLLMGCSGIPAYEVMNYVPQFRFGIATQWLRVDPANPPRFESQAAYLDRHGLMGPSEHTEVTRLGILGAVEVLDLRSRAA